MNTTRDSERQRQALDRVRCATCAHDTREQARQAHTEGTLKVMVWVMAAFASGWVWYGLLMAGKWALRAMGVTLP